MKLSPLEIKKQEFDRSFRGYDTEEVQSFLQMVASQWESLREQNRRLEEEVSELENKIEHYQKVEEALQDALDTARENAQQKMENAEEKADHLVREAEQKAERIRNEAEEERYAIRREVSELKHRRQEIVTRLRAFLISEMEMLAQYEGDDPIGFIKFLPERGDRDERPTDEAGDAPDDVPDEEEMPSAREYLRAHREEEGRDEPPAESPTGSSEHAGSSGGEGPNSREGEHGDDRTGFEARQDSESGGEAAGLGPPATQAAEGEKEEEPRWRVHSVLSEEEEEAEPERADSERADSENRGGGDPTEELSSEEMDKIRRILDDLE